jgi:Xaa-Pro aminopeptidase
VTGMNERLNQLRARLAEKGLDAAFITRAENRRYLSGFHGSAGTLVITAGAAVLATDFRYTEQAVAEAPDFEILRISNSLADWFPGLVNDLGIKTLGFEAGEVSVDYHRRLGQALKRKGAPVKLVPLGDLVEPLRAVKDAGELELIRRAVAIADAAFEATEAFVRPGVTERQVAWELEKRLRESGSEPLPFDIIVASGPNAALPHARPSDRVIRPGDPVVIDMGARFKGYASDLSRTICAGAPDDVFKKVYRTVLEAQQAAAAIITAGVTGHRADGAARRVIRKAGYGEAFGHSLGHGVGLAEHELPRLGPGSHEALADGMVFTIEPGIYLSGWGGVRIEDMAVMENGRARILTSARKASYD